MAKAVGQGLERFERVERHQLGLTRLPADSLDFNLVRRLI